MSIDKTSNNSDAEAALAVLAAKDSRETHPHGLLAEHTPKAMFFAAWATVTERSKSAIPDTPGVYAPYPSYDACANVVMSLITGTGITYLQKTEVHTDHVSVETILAYEDFEYPTGAVLIPLAKADALGIAVALGWARRLSLVQAFGIGTKELPPDEAEKLQSYKNPQLQKIQEEGIVL